MPRKKITFEQAVSSLQDIVSTIENGNMELDQCVELYKQGIDLAVHCGKTLNSAQERVTVLRKQADLFLEEPFEETRE